jgi:lipopolysaccharide heptosyltransferase II
MAQTWPFSRKRHTLLRFVDVVGRAVARPFRRAARSEPTPLGVRRVLVIEPWNVGDVVLATPVLRELRRRYPKAEISILAKPHARELLAGSGLVDDVVPFDLPWTAQSNKYRLTPAIVREMRALVRTLRARKFDMTLDSRMDIRSNLLAAMTGAPYRLGYDIGGGGWLLTHSLPSNRDDSHKIDDWLALLDLFADAPSLATGERPRPTLVVTEDERERARRKLAEAGAKARPLIAYHPGGSHPGKRWPHQHFEDLIRELSTSLGGSHIIFLGPDEKDSSEWPSNAIVFRQPLRELMALLTCCDVLVCNDSGPMHVADALGVPVVAMFEIGNPQWFGPSGDRATVIRGELAGRGVSAAPLDQPPRHPVPVARVATAVRETLRANR